MSRKKQHTKRTIWVVMILLFISISIQSQFQTTPTLAELKALKSIRGQIPGTIVWSTTRHGTWDIYKMNADGTGKTRLTDDPEMSEHPVWSKDGQWIYYQRDDDIYRMRPDGSSAQIVVMDGFSFDITDDNLGLVYVIQEENGSSIAIYDLEKRRKEEIIPARVPQFKGKQLRYPTVSPDGKWLAFSSDYPESWTIHIVRLDGSNLYSLDYGCMPQYRPNGLLLTWISSGDHDVCMGPPDGKNKRRFENAIPGRPHCYFSRWSNNGEYVVFAASPSSDRQVSDYEIYIKTASGGEAVRLTFHPGTDTWPDLYIPNSDSR